MTPKAVLVIGATGRTGVHIIRELAAEADQPKVFAFCRTPTKLDQETSAKCEGVIQGDARNPKDLERAIHESKADMVIVSVGNGDNVKKSVQGIRTANAQALVKVLRMPRYGHVRALIVSSTGAGGSKIKIGFGIGKLIEFHLRHVLRDHDGQEAAFLASTIKERTMIVRPTALTENEPTGKVIIFGDAEKSPTIQTDRKDLADWLIQEAIIRGNSGEHFGSKPINVTCVK